MFLLMLMNGN